MFCVVTQMAWIVYCICTWNCKLYSALAGRVTFCQTRPRKIKSMGHQKILAHAVYPAQACAR